MYDCLCRFVYSMTAVNSVADGRHTHRATTAVRAADVRRTMNCTT